MLDFPDSPSAGQEFVAIPDRLTFTWDAALIWNRKPLPDLTTTNPVITSLDPASMYAISGTSPLTVNGQNFDATSVIWIDGVAKPTTFVSATQLTTTVTVPSSAGSATVMVKNELSSNTSLLTYDLIFRPLVTSVSPNSVVQGSTVTMYTMRGQDFENGDKIIIDGVQLNTTFISQSELRSSQSHVAPFSRPNMPCNVTRSQSADLLVTLTAANGSVTMDGHVVPGVWPHSQMNGPSLYGNCIVVLTAGAADNNCIVYMDGNACASWESGGSVWFTPQYFGHDPNLVWRANITVTKNGVPSSNSATLPVGGS